MGCAGVSKSEWSPVYTDHKVMGTNVHNIGNDGPWFCGIDIMFSYGNRAAYEVCFEESQKPTPAFTCNDDPRYPDCPGCP